MKTKKKQTPGIHVISEPTISALITLAERIRRLERRIDHDRHQPFYPGGV